MQTNLNTNISATPKQNPAFGSIRLHGASGDVLKNVLKPQEWVEFQEIAANAAKNTEVDTIFFADGPKRLMGRIVATDPKIDVYRNYSQRLFEKPLSFIKRLCAKADAEGEKIRKLPKVNPDEIINSLQ